jgi:hypothetical protein
MLMGRHKFILRRDADKFVILKDLTQKRTCGIFVGLFMFSWDFSLFLRGFAPDIGTNVKFLESVFLISTLKKS